MQGDRNRKIIFSRLDTGEKINLTESQRSIFMAKAELSGLSLQDMVISGQFGSERINATEKMISMPRCSESP